MMLSSVIIRKRSGPHPGVVYLVKPDGWSKVKERNTDEVTDIHVSMILIFVWIGTRVCIGGLSCKLASYIIV